VQDAVGAALQVANRMYQHPWVLCCVNSCRHLALSTPPDLRLTAAALAGLSSVSCTTRLRCCCCLRTSTRRQQSTHSRHLRSHSASLALLTHLQAIGCCGWAQSGALQMLLYVHTVCMLHWCLSLTCCMLLTVTSRSQSNLQPQTTAEAVLAQYCRSCI
jgi:hypothetical protein